MSEVTYSHKERTSTAHRYYNDLWPLAKNQAVYGRDCSPEGLGHNFIVEGVIQAHDVDVQKFQHSVWQVSRSIDHEYLSDGATTLEWITQMLWAKLKEHWPKHQVRLNLYEGPRLWASSNGEVIELTQQTVIHCVHRHWNNALSEADNLKLYGKCAGLHGHEYKVDVTLAGNMDAESRLLIGRAEFAALLEKYIGRYEGTYLNEHMGNTSGEKIALYFFNKLKDQFTPRRLAKVAVHETRKNSFLVEA